MAQGASAAFFSYCREDSDFALRLAEDLKAAGASVWLDQLDIIPGQRWDRAVEDALTNCPRMLVILSPSSVSSTNVMDEVSFALEEQKTVIPVIHRDCTVPFRLRRVQHVDFRQDYARGLKELLKTLALGQEAGQSRSAISDVRSQSNVPDADNRQRAAEQARMEQARLEDEGRKATELTRLQEERKQTERARVDQERNEAAERERLDEERKKVEEQALLLEQERDPTSPTSEIRESKRAEFIAELNKRGFKQSPLSERLFYRDRDPNVRFMITKHVVRFEKRTGDSWRLWESYLLTKEMDSALKVIDSPKTHFTNRT